MATCVGEGYSVPLNDHVELLETWTCRFQIGGATTPYTPTSASFFGNFRMVVRVISGTASLRHIEFDFSNIASIQLELIGSSSLPVFYLFPAINCNKSAIANKSNCK